jgi:alpha-ketoglutarate-dependent taurine dioxygenase
MYEIYDRLSPSMAAYLETLTAIHDAKFFHDEAARLGNPLRTTPRGSPPKPAVTGWKGVFVNRGFTRRIQGVTKDESDVLLQYLFNVSCPQVASRDCHSSLTSF